MEVKHWLVVHHSDGPADQSAQEIEQYDLHRPDLCGHKTYAKIIAKDGYVYNFAGEEETDVAQATGFNFHGIGICVVGNFEEGHEVLTEDSPQYHSLIQTLAVECKRHGIGVDHIIGHVDTYHLRGVPQQKDCPGTIHCLLPEIRAEVAKYL